MTLDDTLVVLDTCVLLKQRVSDVVMDLRAEKLFSAHWTEVIDGEFLRNMVKIYGVEETKAQRRLLAMKARCPEWELFMSLSDFAAVPAVVNQKDRHVAAAALALRHAANQAAQEDASVRICDVILVTDNVRDLAEKGMAKAGVRVMSSGSFLNAVYKADPAATTRAVTRAAKDLRHPPYRLPELLHALRSQGASTLVSKMSKQLGVTPVKKQAASARKTVRRRAPRAAK